MAAFKSRATLLLEKEYFKLKRQDIWGIYAEPFEDNIFYWEALIHGPKDTVWEDGNFKLYMIFTEEYNSRPPEVFFQTIPFHPNVDKTSGKPCIDFLDNASLWKNQYQISLILLTLQTMLAFPVVDKAVHPEAAKLYILRPHQYLQMAKDCVYASKRTSAGLPPFLAVPSSSAESAFSSNTLIQFQPSIPVTMKLSFEDYHTLWNELATSYPGKIDHHAVSGLLQKSLRADNSINIQKGELEEEVRAQLQQHEQTMRGRLEPGKTTRRKRIAELLNVRQKLLCQLHTAKQGLWKPELALAPAPNEHLQCHSDKGCYAKDLKTPSASVLEDPGDQEVTELVQWTKKLPTL